MENIDATSLIATHSLGRELAEPLKKREEAGLMQRVPLGADRWSRVCVYVAKPPSGCVSLRPLDADSGPAFTFRIVSGSKEMKDSIESLLDGLNPEQREAVEINSGSLLVFAGAGSGKTRVITTKIAYAVETLGIPPWQILAVTFTNKACREMKERVESFIGEEKASKTFIRTFHSFGVWLLRKYGTRVGLSPNFTIYDDEDAAVLLSQCFPSVPKKELRDASRKISALKDKMAAPPKYDVRLTEYFNAYNRKLSETGNVDFADMITKSIEVLRKNPDAKQYVHERFKMVLVDEYQDSNTAQFLLLQEIVGPGTFVCVVGDDDQSIYRFRGAQVENILNFPKNFPNTRTVVLGRNYRCSTAILDAAQDVILNNGGRAKKNLVADKVGGRKPVLYLVDTETDEARLVASMIRENPPSPENTTAILYRTNAQSKAFEDSFIVNGIPYNIVGSLRFYDREEIRDSIALISLLVNTSDTVAFQRMVNKPPRGIGDVTIGKILSLPGSPLENCGKMLASGEIKGKAATGIATFLSAYNDVKSYAWGSDGATLHNNGEVVSRMLDSFGITAYYAKRDSEESAVDGGRVANLGQLVTMLSADSFKDGAAGLYAFLEFVSLDPSSLGSGDDASRQGDPDGREVTLITMHNTKGLEFDRVFISGMEDEIFPSLRSDSTRSDLEEERRICYVAITRAKRELCFLSARSRFQWGHQEYHTPSRFLSEISEDHIERRDLRSALSKERFGFGGGFGQTYRARGNEYTYDNYDFRERREHSFGDRPKTDFRDEAENNASVFGGGYNPDEYYGDSFDMKGSVFRSGESGARYSSAQNDSSGYKPDRNFEELKKVRNAYLNTARSRDKYESWSPKSVGGKTASAVSLIKRAKTSVPESQSNNKESIQFNVSDRVRSPLLGDGTVESARMLGKKKLLVIRFDSGKTSTFAEDKADLEKIE